MSKMTIEDAAAHFGVSKEAIHNRVRRGSLKSIVEDGVKLVEIDKKASANKAQTKRTGVLGDERYYKLLEEQNSALQNRVQTLEDETRTLRDQKEQMLIQEREKIEQIYKDKDEQLKNILNAISSKFMLGTPIEVTQEEVIEEAHVEAEIEESSKSSSKSTLVPLKKYLKDAGFSKGKREKIKNKFKKIAEKDGRIIMVGKKQYIDLKKYDYSDMF
jgi:hypothetical protein